MAGVVLVSGLIFRETSRCISDSATGRLSPSAQWCACVPVLFGEPGTVLRIEQRKVVVL